MALAPFAAIYTILNFFFGFSADWLVRMLANYSFASFAILYLVGLHANLREHGIDSSLKKLKWFMMQIVLLPIFSIMESTGVLIAILKPVSGFHVVKK